jgi:hypothetical protein
MEKNIMKKTLLGILFSILPVFAFSQQSQVLVNDPGVAYNQGFVADTSKIQFSVLSAQVNYSSSALANENFTGGQEASGTINVQSFAALSSATATDTIVVNSTGIPSYVTISVSGLGQSNSYTSGFNWLSSTTVDATASNIAAAMSGNPFVTATASGNTVTLTAKDFGALYNNINVSTSPIGSFLTLGTPKLTGGQDNAALNIGPVTLLQGRDFTAATSTTATASSIASAINANSLLSPNITASASGSTVTVTSILASASKNYGLVSSSPLNLVVNGMFSGTNPAWVLGSGKINIPNTALTLAFPVLYNQGTSPAIGGLTNQTTYYAIPVDANDIELAATSADAVAGTFIDLTSSSTLSTAPTYTLEPLPSVAPASLQWEVSNDGVNYFDLATSSVTISSFNGVQTASWNFGELGYQYLELYVTAPAQGGLNVVSTLYGH